MSILIGGNKVKRISGKTSHLDWLTIIDSSIRSKIIIIGLHNFPMLFIGDFEWKFGKFFRTLQ